MASSSAFVNINDFDFKPQHKPESIDLAVKWFEEKKGQFSGTTNFCIIYSDGTFSSKIEAACHASLGTKSDTDREVIGTEIAFNRYQDIAFNRYQDKDSTGRELFLKWFLYDSFASQFILNKDDYDFCKNYGIIISCDIPASLLQNIAIVSRHFREVNSDSFDKFQQYVDKGYPPHLCYMLSMNGHTAENYSIYSSVGHRAFGIPGNMASLNNHLRGDIIPPSEIGPEKSARIFCTIYGGNEYGMTGSSCVGLFPHDLLDKDEELRKRLSAYRGESTTEAYKPPNPFAIPAPGRNSNPRVVIIKELDEVILPYMQEKGMFNVSA